MCLEPQDTLSLERCACRTRQAAAPVPKGIFMVIQSTCWGQAQAGREYSEASNRRRWDGHQPIPLGRVRSLIYDGMERPSQFSEQIFGEFHLTYLVNLLSRHVAQKTNEPMMTEGGSRRLLGSLAENFVRHPQMVVLLSASRVWNEKKYSHRCCHERNSMSFQVFQPCSRSLIRTLSPMLLS